MKLEDINTTVFNGLTPEVQAALIESSGYSDAITVLVVAFCVWLFLR